MERNTRLSAEPVMLMASTAADRYSTKGTSGAQHGHRREERHHLQLPSHRLVLVAGRAQAMMGDNPQQTTWEHDAAEALE